MIQLQKLSASRQGWATCVAEGSMLVYLGRGLVYMAVNFWLKGSPLSFLCKSQNNTSWQISATHFLSGATWNHGCVWKINL